MRKIPEGAEAANIWVGELDGYYKMFCNYLINHNG
jgi:hypothetical protein